MPRALGLGLIGVWVVLLGLGAVALIEPPWLVALGHDERQHSARWQRFYAHQLLIRGNLIGAFKRLEEALELAPESPDALAELGALYLHMGAEERARRLLTRALARGVRHPAVAHLNLAAIHGRRRELDTALEHYRRAAESPAERTRALLGVGTVHLDRGDRPKAITALRAALRAHLDLERLYRAALLRFAADASPEDAALARRLEAEAKRPVSTATLARFDLETLQRTQRGSGLAAKLHFFLGAALAESGRFGEALKHLERAAAIRPDDPGIKRLLPRVKERLRR